MKAKVARKAVRHVKPIRKVAHRKAQARAKAAPEKKEIIENVAAAPQAVPPKFEAPVEVGFVEVELAPGVELIEVFEVEKAGGEGE